MSTDKPDLGPGWVDRVVHEHGETNDEQRMKARGKGPWKDKRRADHTAMVVRAHERQKAGRRLDAALGELRFDEGE